MDWREFFSRTGLMCCIIVFYGGQKSRSFHRAPKRCSHNIDVKRGTRSPALLENAQTHTSAEQDWRPPRCLTLHPVIAFPMPIPPTPPSPNRRMAGNWGPSPGGWCGAAISRISFFSMCSPCFLRTSFGYMPYSSCFLYIFLICLSFCFFIAYACAEHSARHAASQYIMYSLRSSCMSRNISFLWILPLCSTLTIACKHCDPEEICGMYVEPMQ